MQVVHRMGNLERRQLHTRYLIQMDLKEAQKAARDYAKSKLPLLLITKAKIPGVEEVGNWMSVMVFDEHGHISILLEAEKA